MNFKRTIGSAFVALTATLVLSASAGATSPIGGYMDAPERAAAAGTGIDAVAYFRANELSTLVQSAGPAAIAYFKAKERATMGPSYVDAGLRDRPVASSSPLEVSQPAATGGFDWADAAVGATSAVMVLLLIGGSFVLVRHSRGRELAR